MKKEENNIKVKLNLALKNHRESNFISAEKLYKEVLRFSPNHLSAIFNLATLYAQSKKFNLAKEMFLKANNIKPQDPNINLNLGNVFFETGDFEKAISFFENLTRINSNFALAHFNKGIVLNNLKKYYEANECFKRVIEIEPHNLTSYNLIAKNLLELNQYNETIFYLKKSLEIDKENILSIKILTELLSSFELSKLNEKEKNDIKNFFIFLYNKNSINHNVLFNNAKLFVFNNNEFNQIKKYLEKKNFLITDEIIRIIFKNKIFLLILQKSLLRDRFLENIVTKIRKEIILTINNFKNNSLEILNFVISLAEQCFLNEYIYFESKDEKEIVRSLKNTIEKDEKIDEFQIAILACFVSLNNSKIISEKLMDYHSTNLLFNDLIDMQVREPKKEKKLINTIKSIGKISNKVSKKVQSQYEENPYPRWRYFTQGIKFNFLNILNSNIKPNKVTSENKFINPKVLIAGCGTGQQLENIVCYEKSDIFAVDLSLSSLAYAKRKLQEQNFNKIEFLHGDILNLTSINKKFDVIECVGVLHHMENPDMGLGILLDLLEPHGFLKLGLYSEISRKHIIEVRNFVKKNNFSIDVNNIRNTRELIKKDKDNKFSQKLTYNYDFYSMSSLRDMIFHVQEKRYTLDQISKLLNNFNLEFLGFTNESAKKNYSISYPNDTYNLNIKNWSEFEAQNPDTFISMYQFWVKKNAK